MQRLVKRICDNQCKLEAFDEAVPVQCAAGLQTCKQLSRATAPKRVSGVPHIFRAVRSVVVYPSSSGLRKLDNRSSVGRAQKFTSWQVRKVHVAPFVYSTVDVRTTSFQLTAGNGSVLESQSPVQYEQSHQRAHHPEVTRSTTVTKIVKAVQPAVGRSASLSTSSRRLRQRKIWRPNRWGWPCGFRWNLETTNLKADNTRHQSPSRNGKNSVLKSREPGCSGLVRTFPGPAFRFSIDPSSSRAGGNFIVYVRHPH